MNKDIINLNLVIHFILIIITGDLAFRKRGLWIVSCCCWIICFILDLVALFA